MKKKSIQSLILTAIIVVSFNFGGHKADAQVVTSEAGPNLWTTIANTAESVWNSGVMKMLEPAIESMANQMLDKVIDSSLNWAFGGFDGEPSFVNNFGDFVKGVKYDELIDWYDKSSQVLGAATSGKSPECIQALGLLTETANIYWDTLDAATQAEYGNNATNYINEWIELDPPAVCNGNTTTTSSTPGTVAEQNYNNQKNNDAKTKRAITRVIALQGKKALSDSGLSKTINLEGETMTKLLGSKEAKEDFNTNFEAGGWSAYIALLEPENTQLGATELAKVQLEKEVKEETDITLTDLQTPVKFLNKTECVEWDTDEKTGKKVCAKNRTLTPGDQVAEKVNKALTKDEVMAENADGLIATLLRSALGKLTKGIVDKGLAGLANKATQSFYDTADDLFANGTIDSQLGYDALGGNDGYGDSSTPNTSTGINSSTGAISSSYIGGPEDARGYGESGAQLIVDLKQDLEEKIAYANQEQESFNKVRTIKKQNQETTINLDRCVPGADYGWEERFKDRFPTMGNDDNSQSNLLSYSNTKEMYEDPKVNIPGAIDMRESVGSILSSQNADDSTNAQRMTTLNRVVSTLHYIRDEIITDFNQQKITKNPNLVLFTDEWEDLTPGQQTSALEYAIENQYAVLTTGETASEIVTTNNSKAKNIVMNASWDIWTKETPTKKKSDLRYSYYIMENDLSNEETVARAQATASRVETESLRSQQLLRDCLVLKSYALGKSVEEIQLAVNQGSANLFASVQNQVNSLLSLPSVNIVNISIFGGTNSSSSDIRFINLDDARTDSEIRTFLENEHQKQLNRQPSLFLTTTITGNIGNSILGFSDTAEKEEYFDALYDDAYLSYAYTKNAMSVGTIIKNDRFYYRGRLKGSLFCRNPKKMPIFGSGSTGMSFSTESACLADWYIASKLDYAVAFSGI